LWCGSRGSTVGDNGIGGEAHHHQALGTTVVGTHLDEESGTRKHRALKRDKDVLSRLCEREKKEVKRLKKKRDNKNNNKIRV
jgi:hypothetical protein